MMPRASIHIVIPLYLFALGGCASAPRRAVAAQVRFDLTTIPSDTMGVSSAPDRTGSMVQFLSNSVGDGAPACAETMFSRITASHQLWPAPGNLSSLIIEGHFDRDEVERCLRDVMAAQRVRLTTERRAAISQLTLHAEGETLRSFLGFGSGFVVWHTEEARVQQLLAPLRNGPRAPVAPLLSRLDATTMSVVYASDFTSRPFGVASSGFVVVVRRGTSSAQVTAPMRLLCASAADATTLGERIREATERPDVPASVRAAVRTADLRTIGAEVELDVMAFMSSPTAMQDLVAWLGVPGAP